MLNALQCWLAVQNHDAGQDGRFFYGVITTGVYCRPSCPSRRPLIKNVRFYETGGEAERDGLRPCLRCRPTADSKINPSSEQVGQVCRYIENHSDEPLKLDELAALVGMNRFHLQRVFKSVVGLTPKQYLDAVRLKQLKKGLKAAADVAEAVYGAGYGSSSRVYEKADTRLGMTPNQYRQGGRGVKITHATVTSPLGLITIGATDRGLCFLQFGDTRTGLLRMLLKEYPEARISAMPKPYHPDFQKWVDALNAYLKGTAPHLHLPVDIQATAFQIRVWNYLQSIPYGEVQSYQEVATGIGQPSAVRAVASACSRNRVALVIPCHRVIRSTGELGGYRWGLARKRVLIDRERAVRSQLRLAN
ncbi:MAG TPA: bifunctional DNA-binding transcriptional regulator/O6-methylguanine-DNA methyltransferase Ada [Candidatus Limnocylindrales bacterium]|nr:bifunctional DNA-binding transcriptional regulator/O6-methylguanine-DNA methyltransferase Ada [Candidatus Limnocylindrales bacterium]